MAFSDSERRMALLRSLATNDQMPDRPGFGAAMMKLMETPGARSDDPMFNRFPTKLPELGRIITVSTPHHTDELFSKFIAREPASLNQFREQYMTAWEPNPTLDGRLMEETIKADLTDSMTRGFTTRGSMTTSSSSSRSGEFLTLEDLERVKVMLASDKITGREVTQIWVDEADQFINEDIMSKTEIKEETKKQLEQLASEMQEYFKKKNFNPAVTLLAPEALTVLVTSKGFTKTSHIGGEEFIPDSVYLGKKGSLIATFKTKDAVAYQHMEMPVADALEKLGGFGAIAEQACEGGYRRRMEEIRHDLAKVREQAELEKKADLYADIGYGSW